MTKENARVNHLLIICSSIQSVLNRGVKDKAAETELRKKLNEHRKEIYELERK